ncbi:MAG: SRPBCC family protein [Pseudomarimonas sp.]
MTTVIEHHHDETLDLQFERIIDVPPSAVWRAWTEPALLLQWFTPAPWKTVECDIDLRPGGAFRTVMESPEGERFPGLGCYLEVIPDQRLVWTNALLPGFRPPAGAPTDGCGDFTFSAEVTMTAEGQGTRYTARVVHATRAGRDKHAAMGFEQGWSAALDQLVALMKRVGE